MGKNWGDFWMGRSYCFIVIYLISFCLQLDRFFFGEEISERVVCLVLNWLSIIIYLLLVYGHGFLSKIYRPLMAFFIRIFIPYMVFFIECSI